MCTLLYAQYGILHIGALIKLVNEKVCSVDDCSYKANIRPEN